MDSRISITAEKHNKGYNCAQAIVCTYCDLFGVDEETAFRLSECFGLGMGGMQSTCGALSGVLMLAGLKNSNGLVKPGSTKASSYALAKKLAEEFKEMNTSTICKELKGIDDGIVKRSCPGCIEDAAKIVEKFLID
ncbi:C-GCAxxG-C-C family protein [uncultured Clostridium sp.]|uniref:C-GCAxxG-C-C family protein n=1 Tax=uncultured Clostridium sp. TaxID=59620 RepID=UPI0025E1A52F|nr:C-GCAxxG-C-C family protein [uncultured Clostridium sp.]